MATPMRLLSASARVEKTPKGRFWIGKSLSASTTTKLVSIVSAVRCFLGGDEDIHATRLTCDSSSSRTERETRKHVSVSVVGRRMLMLLLYLEEREG